LDRKASMPSFCVRGGEEPSGTACRS
jgi:hypothetical protein